MNATEETATREKQLEEVIRMLLFDGFTFGGGCSRRECICRIPGAVCEEFMGYVFDDSQPVSSSAKCPRCGWDWCAHQRKTSGDVDV